MQLTSKYAKDDIHRYSTIRCL